MAKKPIKPPKKRQPIGAATKEALELVAQGWTRYAAAQATGIALSTIYRSHKRQQEQA